MQSRGIFRRLLLTLVPSLAVMGLFALGGETASAEACARCTKGFCQSAGAGYQACEDFGGGPICILMDPCNFTPCPPGGCGQ